MAMKRGYIKRYADGAMDAAAVVALDTSVPNIEVPETLDERGRVVEAKRTVVTRHEPAHAFLARDPEGELDPDKTEEKLAAHGTLPAFQTEEIRAVEGPRSVGRSVTDVMEELVKAAVREGKLSRRLVELEARVLALEGRGP